MVGKIIILPFWIISKIAGVILGSVKLAFGVVITLVRLIFGHIFGAVVGGTVGFLLGRKHVGVKIFNTHKKHHRSKPCK